MHSGSIDSSSVLGVRAGGLYVAYKIKVPKVKHQLTSGQFEIGAQFSLASKGSVYHPHQPLGVAPAFIPSILSRACNPQDSATHL